MIVGKDGCYRFQSNLFNQYFRARFTSYLEVLHCNHQRDRLTCKRKGFIVTKRSCQGGIVINMYSRYTRRSSKMIVIKHALNSHNYGILLWSRAIMSLRNFQIKSSTFTIARLPLNVIYIFHVFFLFSPVMSQF